MFGDYGAGPNHVLPTSGTARFTGGLSVFTFLVGGCAVVIVGACPPLSMHTCGAGALVGFVCISTRPDSLWRILTRTQRVRTWLRSDGASTDVAGKRALIDDTVALAELEGLAGHAAAARARKTAR